MSDSPVKVSLVVAMDEHDLIGADGGMPWYLPADLKHFKRVTMGHPILMGRRTHESIGRALPGRENLVLTRDADYRADGCRVVTDIDAARAWVHESGASELMVIGGAQVYAALLPEADRLHLTRIHARFKGDTRFPALDWTQWEQLSRRRYGADERNPYPYSFITLRRKW